MISTFYILDCAKELGKGAETAERKKLRIYKIFKQLQLYTYCSWNHRAWGKEGLKFIKEIGQKKTLKTNDNKTEKPFSLQHNEKTYKTDTNLKKIGS